MAGEALVVPRRATVRGPLTAPALARLFAFVPLALFGALHWAALVSPGAGGAFVATVAIACAAAAALIAVAPAPPAVRMATAIALALALTAVGLVAAGVPVRLLGPRAWDELASGLGEGISAMPGVTVPYRGVDAWTRTAILFGGTLLVGLATLLAFWPSSRRGYRLPAAIALSALYGIAIVQRNPSQPFFDGAVFCVLLLGFLWLERLRSDQLGVAAAVVFVTTALGAAAVAPRLDGAQPWLDYEEIARDLQPTRGTTFSWDHRYGPLDWSRDGRELLRIKARSAAYWKATNLAAFDGTRWRASTRIGPDLPDFPGPYHEAWRQRIRVVDRGLASQQIVGAGTTLAIRRGPDTIEISPGVHETVGKHLRPGSSYEAIVYVPRPSERQLRQAGTGYPELVARYLDVDVPAARDAVVQVSGTSVEVPAYGRLTVRYAPFGSTESPIVLWRARTPVDDPQLQVLRESPYAKVLALAQQLRARARTPFEYVGLVMARVKQGAVYSEQVSPSPYPLVRFLLDDHRGYCQHFSGAMALLLRMGGVPARVAAGFSPGRFNKERKEYVVRDTDAHSWVEAYFPGYGWVTFDPTPGAAPARFQQADPGGAVTAPVSSSTTNPRDDLPSQRAPVGGGSVDVAPIADAGGSPSSALLILAGILAGALAVVAVIVVRRGRLPEAPLGPELAELQRALHRSGRTPKPATTLAELEQMLGGRDAGVAYVRAVRELRFATGGAGPSRAQRRALRRQLAAGLGLRGRLRAWWALPPLVRSGRRYPEWSWTTRTSSS